MPAPLDILVWTDEPFHASYLARVLDLEAPGLFRVRHVGRGGLPAAGADLVLVQGESPSGTAHGLFAGRIAAAFGAPVIVVARGGMDLADLDRLMHEGADDVLDLGELNARGLAAAVLKAVRRRWRSGAVAGPAVLAAEIAEVGPAVLDSVPESAA